MILEIFFKNHRSLSLVLKEKGEEVDSLDLEFDRNLETILISGLARLNFSPDTPGTLAKNKLKNLGGLDKILNKNKMSLSSLKGVRIGGEVNKNMLSYQIAQAFKKALG